MTGDLALLLAQDGIANGAIYAVVALGIVLIFVVTRVIFVPFGDLVAYAALTLAALQQGRTPGTGAMVGVLAVLAFGFEVARLGRAGRAGRGKRLARAAGLYLGLPGLAVALGALAAGRDLPDPVLALVALLLVLPMGPLLYRVAFRPIADAPVLVLLIVSVVLHFALSGVALMAFGPEGMRPRALVEGSFEIGEMIVSGQEALMLGASAVATALLALFLGRTLAGKALRATAVNRVGARLVGIRPGVTGSVAFALGALLAGVSGVLIGPLNTLAYDSGFILGLKAFVGAIIGGLVSAPGAVAGALFVGLLESFTAFWSSAFKEVVVFALLVPVVVARSLIAPTGEEFDEEEDRA